jgi:sarcosine oxidase subunit beta
MDQYMAAGSCPEILKPFSLRRYQENRFLGEIATPVNYGPWN